MPLPGFAAPDDVNAYAVVKEAYLGDRCYKPSGGPTAGNWSHWSVMMKSGNMDVSAGLCNTTAPAVAASFNNLPMNQPLVVHSPSAADWPLPYTNGSGVSGYYAAT